MHYLLSLIISVQLFTKIRWVLVPEIFPFVGKLMVVFYPQFQK